MDSGLSLVKALAKILSCQLTFTINKATRLQPEDNQNYIRR